MLSLEDETRLRAEAMAWLAARTNDGRDAITRQELTQFQFDGERLTLIDTGRGIRKPANCRAALTIMTVHTPEGRERPYEDVLGADGLPRYKMRGDARSDADNRGLRAAMELGLPVIWLVGVAPGLFQTVFPVFLIGEEPALHQFVLAYDKDQVRQEPDSPLEEVMRRWAVRETETRLHQRVFRSMVMLAYHTTCAVCSLRHSPLLDAAHIVEDRHELGVAAVRNGLSLCKIHHAAYDAGILGISPELNIHIRADILDEIDGPLLEHGIKGLHGQRVAVLPDRRGDRPDPALLDWRYQRFLSA